MILSLELQQFMGMAAQIAARSHHEFFLPEHIALAFITQNPFPSQHTSQSTQKIVDSIVACGANVSDVHALLSSYIDAHAEILPDGSHATNISPTTGVARVINLSAQYAKQNNRAAPTPLDYWVAFLNDPTLDGPVILSNLGVTALKVKEFLSHNITSKQASPFPEHEAFSSFGTHLTLLASQGKLDPVIGRDTEIKELSLDLLRRRKKNVLLVGEPGVGKTAVVEGLAQKIHNGEIKRLIGKRVWSIDSGSLIAGTRFRGDFEERLKKIVNIAEQHPEIILFIDEIHTLIGMGSGSSGNMDAANLLKPALARGNLQLIGATTESESRNIFEKDKALRRRFVKRTINEPDESTAALMIHSAIKNLSKHHNVKFAPEIAATAVSLAKQHIRDLRLPDSALDILDHLGSRKQDSKKTLTAKDLVISLSTLIAKPIELPSEMQKTPALLKDALSKVIFGQDLAIETLYKSLIISQAGLNNQNQPLGSFLFTGPTGVGKTELSKALATQLHAPLVQFDLSEFQEAHSVSKVIGSPPGYVGHGEGGQITAAVRKNPSCVLLLDEFEKAHPAVHRLFLQVLDHGTLTDSQGEVVDFRKCVIIFTTNTGAETIEKRTMGFTTSLNSEFDASSALKAQFPPEFRNRLSSIISFNPLGALEKIKIVRKYLTELQTQLGERLSISYDDDFCEAVSSIGIDPLLGARPLNRWISDNIRTKLAEILIGNNSKKHKIVALSFDDATKTVLFS